MSDPKQRLYGLLDSQALGVVATQGDGTPYASLVAVAPSGPGAIYFATPRATRKFSNLTTDGHVALLLDDRSHAAVDTADAAAATGMGTVRELVDSDRDAAVTILAERHPHLVDFFASPSVAVLEITVTLWYLVQRFQSVSALGPEDW